MSEPEYRRQTWVGGARYELDPRQRDDGVWKNTLLCANCRQQLAQHCKVHMIPCCPGKCPKDSTD